MAASGHMLAVTRSSDMLAEIPNVTNERSVSYGGIFGVNDCNFVALNATKMPLSAFMWQRSG